MRISPVLLIAIAAALYYLLKGRSSGLDKQIQLAKLQNAQAAIAKSILKKQEGIQKLNSIANLVNAGSSAVSSIGSLFNFGVGGDSGSFIGPQNKPPSTNLNINDALSGAFNFLPKG